MGKINRLVHTGNRFEVQFDGKVVGLLQNVRPTDDYGHQPASGIGDVHAVEYVPTFAQHDITVQDMVLFRENLREAGIAAENGDDVLRGNVFDIVVYSKDPQATGVLRKYLDCSYAGGDVNVQKHEIVASSARFKALDVSGKGL